MIHVSHGIKGARVLRLRVILYLNLFAPGYEPREGLHYAMVRRSPVSVLLLMSYSVARHSRCRNYRGHSMITRPCDPAITLSSRYAHHLRGVKDVTVFEKKTVSGSYDALRFTMLYALF